MARTRVGVIPNGIDARWFAARPAAASEPVVIAVNNGFSRWKNVGTLLEAFSSVRQSRPDARLRLVGTDFERGGPAQRWAQVRRVSDGVEFVGPVDRDRLPALIDAAQLFVHPSLEESFGMVALEVMARGVPVVAGRRTGALPWLLDDGEAGLLVDVSDVAELRDAMTMLLGDAARRRRYGERGLQRARDRFSVEASARLYVEALARLSET